MLGVYENFPATIHKSARFTTPVSHKKLQQKLVETLREINAKTFRLEDIADPSVPQCSAMFEFGIAETNNFNYLDDEEADKALRTMQRKPFQVMDFLCAIRYYKTQHEKKTPLRFDYYLIRFVFDKNWIETRIFHERGPRHIFPEDITKFVTAKINGASSRKILKPT
jgi:hypothetical protein